jgi:hypothetical protein
MTAIHADASQDLRRDRQQLIGIWRLVTITEDGKVNPLRGGKPTGYIFYTASGEMGVMIQPERPPIAMAEKTPSPQEAQAALKGYTAYFGTYTVDEKAKIVTHHRRASVQPGYEADVRRHYRFETPDRVVLGNPATRSALVWERVT